MDSLIVKCSRYENFHISCLACFFAKKWFITLIQHAKLYEPKRLHRWFYTILNAFGFSFKFNGNQLKCKWNWLVSVQFFQIIAKQNRQKEKSLLFKWIFSSKNKFSSQETRQIFSQHVYYISMLLYTQKQCTHTYSVSNFKFIAKLRCAFSFERTFAKK